MENGKANSGSKPKGRPRVVMWGWPPDGPGTVGGFWLHRTGAERDRTA